jgi:hypothetical protein
VREHGEDVVGWDGQDGEVVRVEKRRHVSVLVLEELVCLMRCSLVSRYRR